MKAIIILVPVYNDEACLKILCNTLYEELKTAYQLELVVVNDGSVNFSFNIADYKFPIEILDLRSNIGHQKALAIGLSYIYHHKKAPAVIVMDADGEDAPRDIPNLLNSFYNDEEAIIFAKRTGRKENFEFRIGYKIYKLVFRLLTGHKISFGNFVVIPFRYLQNLVYKNDIWNHLAAGILKSNLPLNAIPVARGARFTGKSNMSFTKLILHGLGAITVFVEFVTTRLLILSLFLLVFTTLAIIIIILIKSLTNLAIPGWASTLTGVLMVIFLQSFLLTLSTLLLYLSSQSQRQFIPAIHYSDFISGMRSK